MSDTKSNSKTGLDAQLALLLRNPALRKLAQINLAKREAAASHAANPKPIPTVGKQYKLATKRTLCLHCKTVTDVVVKLEPKDTMTYIARNGRAITVGFKLIEESIPIEATVNTCPECAKYTATLSRSELEQRYISLVNNSKGREWLLQEADRLIEELKNKGGLESGN
jgi:glutaredoxin